jgi:hypothetical protein
MPDLDLIKQVEQGARRLSPSFGILRLLDPMTASDCGFAIGREVGPGRCLTFARSPNLPTREPA